MTIKQIQQEQKAWVRHNFGDRPSWQPLLGVAEELGELSHAHLKHVQGIRVNENHTAKKKDAIGDLVIYLTPVTFGGYSSELKRMVDHQIQNISPFFTSVQGEIHHQRR